MNKRNHRQVGLGLALVGLLLAAILVASFFAGPVKGDPEETMAQWKRYEQLAREYPAK